MKKKISSFVKYLFTILLIIYSLYKAGIFDEKGREEFAKLLTDVNYVFIVLSILITFILNLSSAIKWKMLLTSRKINVSLSKLYVFYNIGKFFNLILPTSMGGDIVRIFQLGKLTGKKHTAAASVIVERFTGLVTLMVFAIIAVIINIKLFNHDWLTISLGAGAAALLILAWLVINPGAFNLIERIFGGKFKIIPKILSKIDKIRKPVLEYKTDKMAIIWAILNSIVFQLLAVINVWVSSLAFSNEVDFVTCLIAVPVILFIMNIPISIGGIGLMEFGYVFTFSLFLISPSLSLSTALLIRAKSILDSIIGGLMYVFTNKESYFLSEIKELKTDSSNLG